jgi:glycerophosphoryl diester phosphodiesterase
VYIQSFEVGDLERLRKATKLRLIQLMSEEGRPADKPGTTYAEMASATGLKAVARRADGIGVSKAMLIGAKATAGLVERAHNAGLQVHVWTFRAENVFLAPQFKRGDDLAAHGDLAAEVRAFTALGIDGLFSDFPRLARQAMAAAR